MIAGELTEAKGPRVVLKYSHTWKQERAAVASKLRSWGFEIAAELIEQGNHWPKKEES